MTGAIRPNQNLDASASPTGVAWNGAGAAARRSSARDARARRIDMADLRFGYGEERIITVGFLDGRMVVVVWTARGENRHVISTRKANDREQQPYRAELERR